MRHYEIVILVHPDQSEQAVAMLERWAGAIQAHGGRVDRMEDWGRHTLAYPIEKVHKAHYLLMNVTCPQAGIVELEETFRFNDAVIRYLVVRTKKPQSGPSPMLKHEKARQLVGDAATEAPQEEEVS